MYRHILYIINPISGTSTRKGIQQLIEKKSIEADIAFKIFPSVANGDYSFLFSIIKEEKITDVIIVGGDGTVSQVVGSLMNCDVNFGIIPCGSGNGLAFTAKIPKKINKALDIIIKGHAVETDGFYVNRIFACVLCGLGFDAKVAHDFAEQSQRGLAMYIKQALKNFFSAKTYPFKIETGDVKFTTDAFFISIANSNQFGNNFTIAPKASLSDGLLDVVIVTKQNKLQLILKTLGQVMGKTKLLTHQEISAEQSILYFQTENIFIENSSSALMHIDGEPAETATKIHIEVKKKCFRLIQPR